MVVHEAACHTSIKGIFGINKDMVQIRLVLEILFTQNSKVADLFCGARSGSEPSLFFSNYLFGLGFKPIQDEFQDGVHHGVSWVEFSLRLYILTTAEIHDYCMTHLGHVYMAVDSDFFHPGR